MDVPSGNPPAIIDKLVPNNIEIDVKIIYVTERPAISTATILNHIPNVYIIPPNMGYNKNCGYVYIKFNNSIHPSIPQNIRRTHHVKIIEKKYNININILMDQPDTLLMNCPQLPHIKAESKTIIMGDKLSFTFNSP